MASFYTISQWNGSALGAEAEITIDGTHDLFKGHFPQMPILPGACMTQLSHHLVDKCLGQSTIFTKATNIKFLAPVNPLEQSKLISNLKISEVEANTFKAEHTMSFGNTTCFKLTALYRLHA